MHTIPTFTAVLLTMLGLVAGCDRGSDSGFGAGTPPIQGGGWVTEPTTPSVGTEIQTVEGQKWHEVDSALDAWTPLLKDEIGDAADGDPTHDIQHVMLVLTQNDVLVRYQLGADLADTAPRDMRFWLEQQDRFLTVETKSASPNRDCTISEVGGGAQIQVDACFNTTADTIDIAIPRTKIPSAIDLTTEFWLSGPQVCCSDESRAKPIDEVDASQGVWRAPETPLSSTDTATTQATYPPEPGTGTDGTPQPAKPDTPPAPNAELDTSGPAGPPLDGDSQPQPDVTAQPTN